MNAWTEEEVAALKVLWTSAPLARVYAGLKGRTKAAIREKARMLKLRRPDHEIKAARLEAAKKGFAASMEIRKVHGSIRRAVKHPIEAAWRGML